MKSYIVPTNHSAVARGSGEYDEVLWIFTTPFLLSVGSLSGDLKV